MNHKGTESKRKSLILNQALILHGNWQSFGLDPCLIFEPLPQRCSDELTPLMLGAPTLGQGQEQTAHGSLGLLLPTAAQPQLPLCWGFFPRHRMSMKFTRNSELLHGLWNTCK